MSVRWSIILAVVAGVAMPGIGAAQKMEQTKSLEIADKWVDSLTLNGKNQKVEHEVTGVGNDGVTGVTRASGKEYAFASAKPGALTQGMCYSNGQQCTFSPALSLAEFPLEKGKKWTVAMTVKGETFLSQVESERQVEKVEKVKVPAGEFEAFRIAHSGRIRGSDAKGSGFSGKEDGRYWVAVINDKAVIVKGEYRNSFGEKFSHELVSAAFK